MKYLIILAFLFAVGCATTGTFSGVVKNPDGSTAYTFEGENNSETTISPTFADGFSILGMSLSEVLLLVGIGGGAIGGGVYGKKKLNQRKNKK